MRASPSSFPAFLRGVRPTGRSRLAPAFVAVALWLAPPLGAAENVRDFGTKADGVTNDAAAIQAAIDRCAEQGGGTVLVPAGDHLTGMLRLRSRVTLRLENGAVLRASRRAEDYGLSGHGANAAFGTGETALHPDYRYLLVADDAEQVVIEGDGVILGTGEEDLRRRTGTEAQPMPAFRVGILLFRNCTDVAVRDVTIRHSDFWTLHFWRCDRLRVRGVSILNNYYHTNSDGIDPVSCRDVIISDCHIVAGDDCICLKADPGRACEQVVVSNCTLESVAAAIKLGTASAADFRDILVTNCTIRNSVVGVGVFIKDGGTAERVEFSHLTISTVDDPALLNAHSRGAICPLYIDVEQRTAQSAVGAVRGMAFRDIFIRSDRGLLLQGMPESPLRDITLQNVLFTVARAADYGDRHKPTGGSSNPRDGRITRYIRQPAYVALAHVDGLLVENVQVRVTDDDFAKYPRAAVAVFESRDVRLQNVGRRPAGVDGGEPVLTLENSRDVLVTGCTVPPGTPVFLGVRGERVADVVLEGNELTGAQSAFLPDSGAPANSVRKK